MREAWINGVSPTLLVGLTSAESSLAKDGSLWRTHHNAWGMMGTHPEFGVQAADDGFSWWPDWPSAIAGAARFLDYYWPNAQTAYNCRGYCEGTPASWVTTVETTRLQIETLIYGR